MKSKILLCFTALCALTSAPLMAQFRIEGGLFATHSGMPYSSAYHPYTRLSRHALNSPQAVNSVDALVAAGDAIVERTKTSFTTSISGNSASRCASCASEAKAELQKVVATIRSKYKGNPGNLDNPLVKWGLMTPIPPTPGEVPVVGTRFVVMTKHAHYVSGNSPFYTIGLQIIVTGTNPFGEVFTWEAFDEATSDWYLYQDWIQVDSNTAMRTYRQDWRRGERCTNGSQAGAERNVEDYFKEQTETKPIDEVFTWEAFDEATSDWYLYQDWIQVDSNTAMRAYRQDWRRGERCTSGPHAGAERNVEYYYEERIETKPMDQVCIWEAFDAPVSPDFLVIQDWNPDPSTIASGTEFEQTRVIQQSWRRGERCTSGPSIGQERNVETYFKNIPEYRLSVGTGSASYSYTIYPTGHQFSGNPNAVNYNNQIIVRARANGNPVAGVSITFSIQIGAGSFVKVGQTTASPSAVVETDSEGYARVYFKHPNDSGRQTRIGITGPDLNSWVTATTIVPTPANFSAYAYGGGSVSLQWDAVPGSIVQYQIRRSTSQGGPWEILEWFHYQTYYTDDVSGFAPGTRLYYAVAASVNGGESELAQTSVYVE